MKHHLEKNFLKSYTAVLYKLLGKCKSFYDPYADMSRRAMLWYKHPQFTVSYESTLNRYSYMSIYIDGNKVNIDMDEQFEDGIEIYFETNIQITKAELSKMTHRAMSKLYGILEDNIQLHKVNQIPCLVTHSHEKVDTLRRSHPYFNYKDHNREIPSCYMMGYSGETAVYFSKFNREDFNGYVTEVEMYSGNPPAEYDIKETDYVITPLKFKPLLF